MTSVKCPNSWCFGFSGITKDDSELNNNLPNDFLKTNINTSSVAFSYMNQYILQISILNLI